MSKLSPAALRARTAKARIVLTDIDGVLTGGTIYHFVDPSTAELVEFKGIHAQDSIAMAWLTESGLMTGVISGRVSKGTDARLRMLKVKHIYQHRLDKAAVLAEIMAAEKLTKDQVIYVGDDIPDLAVMSRVGLAVAPANARPEVKAAAHWVTKAQGGDGAFRELVEVILRSQGLWDAILERYR
ncbi:MAG: HAD hydrolase family protein [Elusimicrobiota bacterium]|nr:HAD hydrolase family protein [Elusimicrobiota bacterium]